MGLNSITDVNPVSNGLLYLPRIEDGSLLKIYGEGGGQIGAQVSNKIGISETLWGEDAWL